MSNETEGAREALVERLAETIEDSLSNEHGTFIDDATPTGLAFLVSRDLAPLVAAQVEAAVSVVRAERDAEVEHWKHHAWEAGEGFKRAIEDFNRANARYRALRARVENLAALTEGPLREGTSTWPECDRDAYSLAIEEAQTALLAPSPAEGTGACCMAGTPLAGPGVTHEVGCTRPAPVVTPSTEDGAR